MKKKRKMMYLRYSPYFIFSTIRPGLISEEKMKKLEETMKKPLIYDKMILEAYEMCKNAFLHNKASRRHNDANSK